jgi:hypothetical protein
MGDKHATVEIRTDAVYCYETDILVKFEVRYKIGSEVVGEQCLDFYKIKGRARKVGKHVLKYVSEYDSYVLLYGEEEREILFFGKMGAGGGSSLKVDIVDGRDIWDVFVAMGFDCWNELGNKMG